MENKSSVEIARFIMHTVEKINPTTETEYGQFIHEALEFFRSENYTKDDFAKGSDLGFLIHTFMFSKLEDINAVKGKCLEIIVREDPDLRRIVKSGQDSAELCYLIKLILDGRFTDKDYILTAAMGIADVMINPEMSDLLIKLNHIKESTEKLEFAKEIVRNVVKDTACIESDMVDEAINRIMKMILES
jgi:hypothetical protein